LAYQLAWLAGMFGGVVIVAALVNRFARANRHRLRRAVVLFSLFAVSTVASLAFASLDPRWSNGFSIASDLFAAFTIANTAGMLLFLIIMPAIFVGLPMIRIAPTIPRRACVRAFTRRCGARTSSSRYPVVRRSSRYAIA